MDGMNVRLQGSLVTSSHGVIKQLTRIHIKEDRSFWLLVLGMTVHHGGEYLTVGYLVARECGACIYLSASPGNQNQGAGNSSLQTPAEPVTARV